MKWEGLERDIETRLPLWDFPMEGGGENVIQGFLTFVGHCILLRIWWKLRASSTGKKCTYTHCKHSANNFRGSFYRCTKNP